MKFKKYPDRASFTLYTNMVANLIASAEADQNKPSALISELISQAEELEKIFVKYRSELDELHRLIAAYQAQQMQVRKKIKEVQLTIQKVKSR
jgi:uncharacterized coiled-coil DUF342 family protein